MSETVKPNHRERLRDRFSSGEESSRSEEALLELLLTYSIPRVDLQPLAARLLSHYGSLSSLLEAPYDDLCQFNGIKGNSAILIKLVDWIRKYYGTSTQTPKEKPRIPAQGTLFDTDSPEIVPTPSSPMPIRKTRTGLFGKSLLKETIKILPDLPDSDSLNEIRSFLRSSLPFSAEQTRQRYTNYITGRMFPEGYADAPLRLFAKAFPDTRELREVCFYRFLLAEPLQAEIVEELLIPNLGTGRLHREHIRNRLTEQFPESKSITDCTKAIVDALAAGGVAKADRTKLAFSYREIPAASFAFVLHSEFPEPGMYDIRKLEENRLIRAMLWNPERLTHALYDLRNSGLISKVSEIDAIRQFTTRYTLSEAVERIIGGKTS